MDKKQINKKSSPKIREIVSGMFVEFNNSHISLLSSPVSSTLGFSDKHSNMLIYVL